MSSDVILQPRQEIEPPSTRAEDDPRRAGSVVVSIRSDGNGTLTVDGEMWGAVEWSEKHGVWCIEDAEGQCLNHTASIRGKAESREEAIAFAEQMIREGTMPSPEEARRLHRERLERQREQRDKQPAENPKGASARGRKPPIDRELCRRADRARGDPVLRDLRRSFRPRRSRFVEVQLVRDVAPAPARRSAGGGRPARV